MNPVRTEDDEPAPSRPRRAGAGPLWVAVAATLLLSVAVIVSFSSRSGRDVATFNPNEAPTSPLDDDQTSKDLPGEKLQNIFFERYDPVSKTFGREIGSLADHATAPMVLNFWASSCAPCVAEMPAIQSMADQYGGQVVFLGITQGVDPTADAVKMIDSTGVTYRLGRDKGGAMTSWFHVNQLPTTIFVQADGTIVEVHVGPLDAADIEKVLTEKLGL